jgi:hypothetical protein
VQKIHKIDLIFIVGIICLGLLGGIIDGFYWKDIEYGGFPVFCMMSIFASYVLWIVLLIYSSIAYKRKEEKPTYVKWYMYFVLPFLMIVITMASLVLTNIIINTFNL